MNTIRVSRRAVVGGMSAWGLLHGLGCAERLGPPESQARFPLGVAAGDPSSDQATLWCRYVGAWPLQVVLWEGDVETTRADATPSEHGYVLVDVRSLRPGTSYAYAFVDQQGAWSRRGHFRTAPADDALEPLSLGALSCANRHYSFATLERAAEQPDLDLVLMLGDNAYVDSESTLEGYRDQYERTLAYFGARQLRAAHAQVATWDDHEFQNDFNSENISAERLAAGAQAFFEHMPLRRPDPEQPLRIWRNLRWGRTAELFVLDCRSERRPSTRLREDAEYISRAQMAWLKQGLQESDAVFKVILNSVPITEFGDPFLGATVADRWEGYAAQRREILRFIDDEVQGALWLSGDFHLASMGRVSREGPGAHQVELLVGPAAQQRNLVPSYPSKPQFDWSSGKNNFTRLDFDPATRTVTVRFIDGQGLTIGENSYAL